MADKHFFNKNLLQKQKRKREDLHEVEGEEGKEGRENVELTLGLSLNGKFGVDPRKGSNKLKRSCSAITTFDKTMRFELDPSPPSCTPSWVGGGLARTCSLPVVEEDEESRQRKELQTIRRREAKRRLSEKLKSCGAAAATNEEEVDEEEEVEERDGSLPRMVSQGSSGSSGLSEFESQTTPPNNGINKATEAKSPQSVQSFSEQKNATQDVKPSRSVSAPNEMAKNVLADMPCVFTKGDGPNGKRVDGFLYRYKKGEEVRILCVCHGTFLTPAEFIKHAGGGDVEHPLRHIVVNPTPFL